MLSLIEMDSILKIRSYDEVAYVYEDSTKKQGLCTHNALFAFGVFVYMYNVYTTYIYT